MRRILAASLLSLLTLPALAQAPAPATAAPAPAVAAPSVPPKPARPRQSLQERFAAANATHDGKLTLDQARAAKWGMVARDFAAIDKGKKGFVTLDDIRSAAAARREARRATVVAPKT